LFVNKGILGWSSKKPKLDQNEAVFSAPVCSAEEKRPRSVRPNVPECGHII